MDSICIHNLTKSYGDVQAVRGISFSVEQGSLFAFLGLNGAGKSTTIHILSSILAKDSGKVLIGGYDLDTQSDQIRRIMGIVFQHSVLDQSLQVRENLRVRASLYGIHGKEFSSALDDVTQCLDLQDILNRPYGKLSGGQRRRVDIARALIARPKILILDEPTTGLDPQTRMTVWDRIEQLRRSRGMTVFLTTHYMEEANRADRVVILDSGKIVANDTPVGLKNKYATNEIRLYLPRTETNTKLLQPYGAEYRDGQYRIAFRKGGQARDFLLAHPEWLDDFEVVKGDMDTVFLQVTGKQLQGGSL